MKRIIIGLAMTLVSAGLIVGSGIKSPATPPPPTEQIMPGNFTAIAQKVGPGVVNIRTVKTISGGGPVFRHFFGNPFGPNNPFGNIPPFGGPPHEFKQKSLGSGFIIDREGYIVTNNHVIENADQIKVRLADEKEFDAELVGRDPKTDLALIKIEASENLYPLEMGDSDLLEVGRWVVAVGSPFGLEQTVTAGIVSAKGRTIGAGPYDDFIQTDASINPGNSGGPLVNMTGEVVGINTAIIPNGQGIGFAIPVNLAKGIIHQLKNGGSVTRGWLGIGIQDLTSELAEYYNVKGKDGVLVSQVYDGDPADRAGIKVEDIIIEINGKPVSSSRELSSIVANTPVGTRVKIKLLRQGKQKTVQVELAKRSETEFSEATALRPDKNMLGLALLEATTETARRFAHPESEKGAIVTDVMPGSRGEQAGILRGDLIKEINRKPISSPEEYRKVISKVKTGEAINFLIKRPGTGLVVIKIIA